jgi:signal transduction histidine kinase/Tfp pilus assembly protein PilF
MSKTAFFAPVCAIAFAVVGAHAAAPPPAMTESASGWRLYEAKIADAKKAMMADPKAALEKARQAVTIAEAQPASPEKTEALATSLWLEGESLTRINKTADAQLAITEATKLAAASGKTTALDGNLALSQARLADANGDIGVALKSYQRAHDIFSRLNIPRYQAIALQGLGSIYDKAHDFDREIEYYRRASQVYSEEPGFQLSAANNIGFALQQLGRYDEAIDDFQQALKIARTMQSPYLEANILTNLAAAYAKSHRFKEAENAANRALKLLGPKDESGGAPFVWGVKAEAEFQRGNISAAVSDIDRAFKGIDLKTTISAFRDMHEIAYRVYKAAGDNSSALAHLEAFKRLDDQGRSLTASTNLALMNAQFEFANQKFEIEHLKSEQLKRDMSLRESRAATQRALFSAVLLAGLALMLWISWRHMTLRRHRNELHKTLGERDVEIERRIEVEAELRVAKVTAEQANKSKSHFLANMSHELRTPLNAIIGFSNLLTMGALKPEKTQEYACDINTSGSRLLEILNDILDMAQIDAGSVKLCNDEVIPAKVVENAILAAERERSGHGKTIRIADRSGGAIVCADESRLRQVLTHLLSNAVKFTGPDGAIDIAIDRVEDGIDFVVRDNGTGISEEMLSLVLEPFGQAEGAYARSHGGIGLGLPIVKSLVELHGGTFTLSSEKEAGTTARVHLPAHRVIAETQGVMVKAS